MATTPSSRKFNELYNFRYLLQFLAPPPPSPPGIPNDAVDGRKVRIQLVKPSSINGPIRYIYFIYFNFVHFFFTYSFAVIIMWWPYF